MAEIIPLHEADRSDLGGKARGLAQLIQWKLPVPGGFVVSGARPGEPIAELRDAYASLGAATVAVRSSAVGEDGSDSSFAGQYETILGVSSFDDLLTAIDACTASLDSATARSYREEHGADGATMNVVVQQMVDARCAGVLFTADPVSGRRDRLVIDAVAGIGESLVSGERTPDHFELDRHNRCTFRELSGETPLITDRETEQLARESRFAAERGGIPLDLEWAIDQDGTLYWLQARPITTLPSDLNELDTPVSDSEVLTRCNVGEMMPGANCPLTLSTTGRAIEEGMQSMQVAYAGRPAVTPEWTQIACSHGKMFINLSGSAAASSTVLGVDVDSLGLSVCGRIVDELVAPPKASLLTRIGGAIRLGRYLYRADAVIDELAGRFVMPTYRDNGSPEEILASIRTTLELYYETTRVHLQSSATSGFAANLLQAILSGGQTSTAAEQAQAARWMAGATGVESAVMLEELAALVDGIRQHQDFDHLRDNGPEQLLAWLDGSHTIGDEFRAFLERHGHRGYRELCVREPAWGDDPIPLARMMLASMANPADERHDNANAKGEPPPPTRAIRWALRRAHNGTRRRERTKSMMVRVAHHLKRSYRALAAALQRDGVLPGDDADLIFFLTHDEIEALVGNPRLDQAELAAARRRALDYQDRLEFDEICVGPPQPIERQKEISADGEITGRPVSCGIVEGIARVAHSVEEAAALRPGEILVAPITDVGWTPSFSIIAGLVTDVGSAVSHGAVVAREYGLPAVVNTRIGTRAISTGDRIRLDADHGRIEVLERCPADSRQ